VSLDELKAEVESSLAYIAKTNQLTRERSRFQAIIFKTDSPALIVDKSCEDYLVKTLGVRILAATAVIEKDPELWHSWRIQRGQTA
jgi:hypothetical protein